MRPLRDILEEWRGTPWMHGQIVKGGGVDCFQFLVAVYQEWTDRPISRGVVNPIDAAYHAHQLSVKTVFEALDAAGLKRVKDGEIKSADVLVCCYHSVGTPTHGAIVSPTNPILAWHSTQALGVHTTSVQAIRRHIRMVFRHPEVGGWSL